ncbi:YkvA family protein [Streptomyces sp. NBC_01497]|uniref:YkvA family protein n=1 Tax=Streptomyces sp. NBC_01497 TaxID=2903885 RepID=UPI002E31B48B|nr:YkvA family protein [Streptomyces sp. NBC_01497]
MDDRELWVLLALGAAAVAAMLAVAVTLAVRLVRTRRLLRRAGLPTGRRWVFWAALAYLVLPTDLMPDPVYLDDIGVLLLALRALTSAAPPEVLLRAAVPAPHVRSGRSAGARRTGRGGPPRS